jgi:hypothetical protein
MRAAFLILIHCCQRVVPDVSWGLRDAAATHVFHYPAPPSLRPSAARPQSAGGAIHL